ncbi:MAG TPA: pyridoxal-phosphate dependent enzyme [Chitinophagales bacterium]|nr:pyridoxal-phosphate dependent enzyme [Chitinophagales bacterium]
MFQLPSPLQPIENEWTKKFNVQVLVKRDDLIHPEVSGNKWRKLKYNIQEAMQQRKNTLLTFGGAFSNHITATAAAGKYLHLNTIGIIRGEEYDALNPSLQFAKQCGMQLYYLSRKEYKNLRENNFDINNINIDFNTPANDIYIIPEGGANEFALIGCSEIVDEINVQLKELNIPNFDFIFSACGTGATIAGISNRLQAPQKAIGVAVLKHETLKSEIMQKFPLLNTDFSIVEAHFGGYAKTHPELIKFIVNFQQQHHIPLDFVYTGKLFYKLFNLIETGYFPSGATIIAVHTGGVMNAKVA